MVKIGIYQHYKGNYYKVIGFANHHETRDKIVIYQELYGNYELWVRPAIMFQDSVVFDNNTISRFKFITESIEDLQNSL